MRATLVLALALWSASALAHDVRSSAVEVDITGSLVVVDLSATQAELHAALEKRNAPLTE